MRPIFESSHKMKRKEFILSSAGLLISLALDAREKKSAKKELGCIASPFTSDVGGNVVNGVLLLDLDNGRFKQIATPFAIHKISIDPVQKDLGYGLASYSNAIAKFDLKREVLLDTKEFVGDFEYSGHSQVSNQGIIYATAFNRSMKPPQAVISLINKTTLEVFDKIVLLGMNQAGHDLQFSTNSDILITTIGNKLCFVNKKSKKIEQIKAIEFDIPGSTLNHFSFTKNGDFGIQANLFEQGKGKNNSSCKDGALVLFNKRSDQFKILRQKNELASKLKQDFFSICLNSEDSILCIAHPWDNFLTFWDIQSETLIKGLDCPHPAGVTLTIDRAYFVVTTSEGLRYFRTKSLEEVTSNKNFQEDFKKIFFPKSDKKRMFHSTAYSLT